MFQTIKITERKVVALVCPHDSHTEYVVERALRERVACFIIYAVGDISNRLQQVLDMNRYAVHVEHCANDEEASRKAVEAVRNKEADVLMKGTVKTDILLHAVLDKQHGLLEPGAIMTHITIADIPALKRMLLFSDAAVLPQPNLEQFDTIVKQCADACRRLGISQPRIALTHCAETVNPKFPHTISYAELKRRTDEGAYGNALVDGPMDVKTALDTESSDIKGINSPVAGKADVLVFPNIQAGNTFYKTLTLFAGATVAGLIVGTKAPIVVASRADSDESKYYSLVMACAIN